MIILFHGGKADQINDIKIWGVRHPPFYMTPNIGIAEEAARSYGPDGGIMRVQIPEDDYKRALEEGLIVQTEYFGELQASGQEVIINSEKGVAFLNEYLIGGIF